jgi:hypothetical protein
MRDWAQVWFRAFEELQGEIEGQLSTAVHIIDNWIKMRNVPRSAVESYVLWWQKDRIKKLIPRTPLARSLEIVMPAFAYAAQLLPLTRKDDHEGRASYAHLVKQRISLIERSEAKHQEAAEIFGRTFMATRFGLAAPAVIPKRNK